MRMLLMIGLADSAFWPAGVDADRRNGRLYVASVRHRTIAEIDPSGTTRELIARDRADLGPIFGVRVGTARNVLWATMSGYRQIPGFIAAGTAVAALLEIHISDRDVLAESHHERDRFDLVGRVSFAPGCRANAGREVRLLRRLLARIVPAGPGDARAVAHRGAGGVDSRLRWNLVGSRVDAATVPLLRSVRRRRNRL